ncbi:uncharacterized protein LOC115452835 [Manduca sexta]|uniref:Uncharacterized protein n=1 Tax=Manduca sexta TaxID=7130 RepID=A0A921ZUZ0_MANSE|nr:uncharacterized protein LOC115452835 [Manduca sexta]KAG6464124.1 hypothetical protein O3G_MSEX014293 [Manduca sexta]
MYFLTLFLIGGALCKPYDGYYCMPYQAPYPCQNYYQQDYYNQQPFVMKPDSPGIKEEPEIPPPRPVDPVPTPRKKTKRVLTRIFSIPGALADSFLSGEISV